MPGPRSSGGDAKKSKTLLIGGTWWLVTNQAIFSLSLETNRTPISPILIRPGMIIPKPTPISTAQALETD